MAKNIGKSMQLRKLTTSLREFADSLPTESEKQELQRTITVIVDFLAGIQRLVAATPSKENTVTMQNALHSLDQFAEQAKSNPAIALLLGVPQPRRSKPKPATYAIEETTEAQQLLMEIQSLPVDEMRSRLQDEAAVTLRLLQALATQLGIRSVQRMGRDVLAHQIASKISNYRGYQGLRAGTETA